MPVTRSIDSFDANGDDIGERAIMPMTPPKGKPIGGNYGVNVTHAVVARLLINHNSSRCHFVRPKLRAHFLDLRSQRFNLFLLLPDGGLLFRGIRL